jgi:hypothetical protein
MRKLTKPVDDPGIVFRTCISRVKNVDLKSRLTAIEGAVEAAAKAFDNAASTTTLHTLLPQNDVNGVTIKEMSDVYTNRMAKKDTPGRLFYDKLLAAPEHGRCPLCGQRVVSTLDHHLPKTKYPAFTVVLTNLVPACADCNKTKIDIIPKSADQETFHPYFDDIETDLWLDARVIETSPAVLQFFVKSPIDWDDVKVQRIKNHFKLFKLSSLYTSHAATELINIQDSLSKIFSRAGYQGVNTHLYSEAKSREVAYLNSWQTAMYRALATSHWYCSEGFRA